MIAAWSSSPRCARHRHRRRTSPARASPSFRGTCLRRRSRHCAAKRSAATRAGLLAPAGTGHGADRLVREDVRGDRIGWLDESDPAPAERALFTAFEALRVAINRELAARALALRGSLRALPARRALREAPRSFPRRRRARAVGRPLSQRRVAGERRGRAAHSYRRRDAARRARPKAGRSSRSSPPNSSTRCCRRRGRGSR